MLEIREEKPGDSAAVHRVNELAFGRSNEADLVDALRAAPCSHLSLVAVKDGLIVGHIFFSPVSIESIDTSFSALGLAPMAVLPECQKQGIGSELVRAGLRECAKRGHPVVVVLGHPGFYRRFGFSTAKDKGITCEYPVPDEVFMVAELTPGTLKGRSGVVKDRPEFASV